MKRLILNIASLTLITVMIFSVMGLQFHYHTCGKTGERTFKIIETPECACEVEAVEISSCCKSEHNECSHSVIESNHCNSYDVVDSDGKIYLKSVNCCQDEIYDIILKDAFVSSGANNLTFHKNITYIYDYNSIKLRFEEFRNKITKTKFLIKMPRDIVLEIIRIILHSSNRDGGYISFL